MTWTPEETSVSCLHLVVQILVLVQRRPLMSAQIPGIPRNLIQILVMLQDMAQSLMSESLVLSLRRLHILPPSSGGHSAVDGTPGRRQLAPSAAAASSIKLAGVHPSIRPCRMSMRTLPLVFINLGGEMLYILDQRLRAHNTSEDKSDKGVWSESDRIRVMNDIIRTMFSKAFMDELLKPQRLYSHRTLKTVLTRVAHTSIMRLSPASMDRLYELMVMAFKYQVFLCPRPKDLLLISYNHIDAVRELAKDTPAVVNHVDETHRRIMEVYSSLSEGEFQLLRQTLLIFFQDMNVRVSIFLKSQVQNPSGRFAMSTSGPVPHGIDVPGLIRLFNRTGREVRRSEFPTGGSYTSPIREGSLDLRGDRVIKLGTNMFTETHPEETKTSGAPSAKVRQLDETPNPLAKEELNLLARLMGSVKAENVPRTETGFRINLFPTEPEDEAAGAAGEAEGSMFEVINIQAVQDERAAAELAWIAGQFTDEEEHPENSSSSKGEDLLAMMDELRPTAEPNHQNQT